MSTHREGVVLPGRDVGPHPVWWSSGLPDLPGVLPVRSGGAADPHLPDGRDIPRPRPAHRII